MGSMVEMGKTPMMMTCERYLLRQLESDLVKPSCIFCFVVEHTVVSEQSMYFEEPLAALACFTDVASKRSYCSL